MQSGDCDPAGIVYFPNFSRWVDAAFHDHFRHCGLPPWREIASLPGYVGAPLPEVYSRFHASATDGESLEVLTATEEWRDKVFVQVHRISRGETLIGKFRATRALCVKQADGKLNAVVIPDFIRTACS